MHTTVIILISNGVSARVSGVGDRHDPRGRACGIDTCKHLCPCVACNLAICGIRHRRFLQCECG